MVVPRSVVAALCLLAARASAGEEAGIRWTHEGHAALPAAARDAKAKGKRLLVGLAGSPT